MRTLDTQVPETNYPKIGGRMNLNFNLITYIQGGKDSGMGRNEMPENYAHMTYTHPYVTPSPFVLTLDISHMLQELQKIKQSEVDHEWPSSLGIATVAASQSVFDRIWNSPEEDEAWRDL